MTKNTEEWLDCAKELIGETKINESVVMTAIEYIERELMDNGSPDDLISLDELEGILCEFE